MDKIVIEGGRPLRGRVEVNGAKNAALPIMAACILVQGPCEIHNVPRRLRDTTTMTRILGELGVQSWLGNNGTLVADSSNLSKHVAPYELVRTMRASFVVLGPLLARMGKAKIALPGGCAIGARPVNFHLKGLEQLGARITISQGYVEAAASRLRGAKLYLDYPSVGATQNLMMAACLAEGRTVIENAAREPEVEDLADFLNQAGAQIFGSGSDTIEIEGVQALRSGSHTIVPDRIEAGTFIMACAITGGEIILGNANKEHLETTIAKLGEAGVVVEPKGDDLRIRVADGLRPCHVKTLPYPGFPTDLQAQMMALMSVTQGTSTIAETVFENRFMHVGELRRMGADIEIEGYTAIVRGVDHLSGAEVMASDLRASAALILAGLVGEGTTRISRVYHIDRGYERIEERLAQLGAKICRVRE